MGVTVSVPAGDFWMGYDAGAERGCSTTGDDQPYRKVWLDAFEIEETEVTVDAYAACVKDGDCLESPGSDPGCNRSIDGRGAYPVNCVSSRGKCSALGRAGVCPPRQSGRRPLAARPVACIRGRAAFRRATVRCSATRSARVAALVAP